MVPKFIGQGIQVAGMVPFKLDEPADVLTFRVGLFGLDKLKDTKGTVENFRTALVEINK